MASEPTPSNIWAHFQGPGRGYGFDGSHGRHTHLLRQIRRLARSQAPAVLNIGVGDGHLERSCVERGWSVASLDPDPGAISALAAEGIEAKTGSIVELPFPAGRFDFVVASEVIEHLTLDQRAVGLREIARVLAPGGRLLGTVPYDEKLERGVTVCPQCSHVFHRWGHTTSFNVENLRGELTAVFDDVACYRAALVEFSGRSFAGKAKSAVRWILGRFGAAIAYPSIVFVAQRPSDPRSDPTA